MGGNGEPIKAKEVAKILMTKDGQIVVGTKIKSHLQVAKLLSQATFNVLRQIPDEEDNKIIQPKTRVDLPGV